MDAVELCGFTKWIKALVSFGEPVVEAGFSKRSLHDRLDILGRDLLNYIQLAPEGRFLLPALMRWVAQVNEQALASPLQYQISSFESWLERASGCSFSEQRTVRAKIMGQSLPRSVYQEIFPIGQDRILPGSHIVTAHSSPDLDTTVSSFWGWCDAFAAPTSRRLHHWNVPGGLPDLEEIQLLFQSLFGDQIFESPKARSALALTAFDLLAGTTLQTVSVGGSLHDLEPDQLLVAVTHEEGYVVGELRPRDIDQVRQITTPMMDCLRWLERHVQQRLIDYYAEAEPKDADLEALLARFSSCSLKEAEPFTYFSETQRQHLEELMRGILGFPKGTQTPLSEWPSLLARLGLEVPLLTDQLQLLRAGLNRADAFRELSALTHVLSSLDGALWGFLERVEIVLRIKREILKRPDEWVGVGADVEEMRAKVGENQALLVLVSSGTQGALPEGMILAQDLRNPVLGTVSVRDFSNRDEVRIPPYLEVMAALDHHKIALTTQRPATIFVADVQSANTLVAEQMLLLQTPYASGGRHLEDLEAELAVLIQEPTTPQIVRLRRRILERIEAAQQKEGWVAPERQYWQAVYLIFAILDDTDLLSKVSWRDVHVVATLLNLLASLDASKEVEEIELSDLPKDQTGCLAAAQRLLNHERMSRWIHTVYQAKEISVNQNLELAAQGLPSSCFRDLKIQNGCAAVSQLKLFPGNFAEYHKLADALRQAWLKQSQETFKQRPELDLYVHMVSTIAVRGREEEPHRDELWIWTPPPEASRVHLRVFLSNLQRGPLSNVSPVKMILLGTPCPGLVRIVEEAMQVPIERSSHIASGSPMLVLEFPASILNSRKASITPCLPGQAGSA